MTDSTTLQADSPILPEPSKAPSSRWLSVGLWVALGVAGASLAGVVWQSQRLSATQAELARRLVDTRAESLNAVATANKTEALVGEISARLGVAELRVSEVSLQRSQLEELILTVSRSRDDSLVFDLDSSIRLAYQQSQLTGSPRPLLGALQAASSRIERAAQPRLNPVQRAMERDIERLQAAALLDVPQVVGRLDDLIRQADAWALLNQASMSTQDATATAEAQGDAEALDEPTSLAPDLDTAAAAPLAPEAHPQPAPNVMERFTAWRQDWTARMWTSIVAGTSDLVRVSRIDQPEAALLAPEQSFFLRENIKLVLLNARLALLAGKLGTARADLATAHELLGRYFDDQTGLVRVAMVQLNQMQKEVQQDPLPRPDETLQALAVAASGR
jgi:uroporphyrin-III C-methyltransferase